MRISEELQHQLTIETAGGTPAFEELLALASEACLSSPDVFDRQLAAVRQHREDERTNIVTSRLGLWGVREYLEVLFDAQLHDEAKVAPKTVAAPSPEYAAYSEAEESAYELLESLEGVLAERS